MDHRISLCNGKQVVETISIDRSNYSQHQLQEWQSRHYTLHCTCRDGKKDQEGPLIDIRPSGKGKLYLRARSLSDHSPDCDWVQESLKRSLRTALAPDGTYNVTGIFPPEMWDLSAGTLKSSLHSGFVKFEKFLLTLCKHVSGETGFNCSAVVQLHDLINTKDFDWSYPIPIHELLRFEKLNETHYSVSIFIGRLVQPSSANRLAVESCVDGLCCIMECEIPHDKITWGTIAAVRARRHAYWEIVGTPVVLGK